MSPPLPHPVPPQDINSRKLPIIQISSDLFRLHKIARDPIYYGSSGFNRFDSPAKEYGILYLGLDAYCAFIETYGYDRKNQSVGFNLITRQELDNRCLCKINTNRPLKLVDLTGSGFTSLGADGRLFTTEDYSMSQKWALSLWKHPDSPDGIYYRSRHDPSRYCIALYDDKTKNIVNANCLQKSLIDPQNIQLLANILNTYGYGIL